MKREVDTLRANLAACRLLILIAKITRQKRTPARPRTAARPVTNEPRMELGIEDLFLENGTASRAIRCERAKIGND